MFAKILLNKKISAQYYFLRLSVPKIAEKVKPGQFIMIKVNESSAPLLRRPMSICLKDKKSIEILYQVVGQGTKILSQKNKGEELDILGPLGNGFIIPQNLSSAFLVAGGMGIAPLMLMARELKKNKVNLFLSVGGKTKNDILAIDFFKSLKAKINIFTDNGSLGEKGLATEGLSELIKNNPDRNKTVIYSCGPQPMLKTVALFAQKNNFNCQVSLDRKMACGFGVCLGCVVKTASAYKCVCKDGPVFDSKEIDW